MHPIASRVLTASAPRPLNDPVYQTIRVRPFVHANATEEATPSESKLGPGSPKPGWSVSSDESYAFHSNGYAYINIFPLRFDRDGVPNIYPEVDLGHLLNPFMVYAIADGMTPSVYRGMLRMGLAVEGQEPCWAWISPPISADASLDGVAAELEAAGRFRSLLPSDVPTLLSVW